MRAKLDKEREAYEQAKDKALFPFEHIEDKTAEKILAARAREKAKKAAEKAITEAEKGEVVEGTRISAGPPTITEGEGKPRIAGGEELE